MKRHVRDRISLAAAAATVAAMVVVAIVALSRADPPKEPDSRLAFTSPSPTPDATATPPTRTLSPPDLLGTQDLPDPGPVRPPKPGTYRYSDAPSDPENRDARRVLEITDRGGGRQREVLNEGLVNDVVWRGGGKYARKVTYGQPEGATCEWEPEILELKLPLAKTEWDRQGTCDLIPGVRVEMAGTSRAVGLAHVRAAGEDLIVWVIRTEYSSRLTSERGTIEQRVTWTDHFSPKHGLNVRRTEHVEGGDPFTGKDVDYTTISRLLNLTPS